MGWMPSGMTTSTTAPASPSPGTPRPTTATIQGSPQELLSAVKWGYLFQGQICKWQQKKRGTSTFGVPAARFVTYLENHDQVANSSLGLHGPGSQTSPGRYRAMATLWLLAPQTPMFFQGQELGSSRPFVYFSDHRDRLADLAKQGRREELSGFRSTTHPGSRAYLPRSPRRAGRTRPRSRRREERARLLGSCTTFIRICPHNCSS